MIYVWHHAAALGGSLALCAAVYRRPWTRVRPRAAVALWHLIVFTTAVALLGLLLSLGLRGAGLGVVPAVGSAGEIRGADLGMLLAATIVIAAGVPMPTLSGAVTGRSSSEPWTASAGTTVPPWARGVRDWRDEPPTGGH